MKTNRLKMLFWLSSIAMLDSPAYSMESSIKLTGRKDLVLSVEIRQNVLSVGRNYITEDASVEMPLAEDLKNPFMFEVEKKPVATAPTGDPPDGQVEEEVEKETKNYADSSVLDIASASFAKKVRGFITRGETSYLQLEGGALLKLGTSFPVRLPDAKDRSYTLTITEISSDGYELQIGDERKRVSYDQSAELKSGSIQLNNP